MLLPNAERAFVDLRKLADYCLDPTHPVGRHKARVFRKVLGFTAAEVSALYDLLLAAINDHEVLPGQLDEFGQRYTMDFSASTAAGSAVIRAAWIIRADEDVPRLTTCFVLND